MTYAVGHTEHGIALWCSERDSATPPAHFRRVTRSSFRRAWRVRDGVKAFGLWPFNPYEAAR